MCSLFLLSLLIYVDWFVWKRFESCCLCSWKYVYYTPFLHFFLFIVSPFWYAFRWAILSSVQMMIWMWFTSVFDLIMMPKKCVRTGITNVFIALMKFLEFSFVFRRLKVLKSSGQLLKDLLDLKNSALLTLS